MALRSYFEIEIVNSEENWRIQKMYSMPLLAHLLRRTGRVILLGSVALLGACDIPGLGPDPVALKRQAEYRAIGGACRYGLRSIEDCFTLNEDASKAEVFFGWKEMDQYMRDNTIEGSASKIQTEDQDAAQPSKESAKTEVVAGVEEIVEGTKPAKKASSP